jgi:NAD(P) transhydrogenase
LEPKAPTLFPNGIYKIPKISYVGKDEEELTQENVPCQLDKASFREIACGQISGASIGTLKKLFHRETRELLGVPIIGESPSEMLHIGQAMTSLGGRIDYFVYTVFEYLTLAECHKTAALDCVNRMNECGLKNTVGALGTNHRQVSQAVLALEHGLCCLSLEILLSIYCPFLWRTT